MPLKYKVPNIILLCLLFVVLPHVCNSQNMAEFSRIKTVVIDPGHGGKHPGAISKNGKYKEKNITLAVALRLGSMIRASYPDINIVYTRSKDVYVDLSERANIANKSKADLFISIHVNSTKGVQANGTETFVMGASKNDENFEVCKTENSVIVIEDDYEHKYEGFNPSSPESYIIFSLLQNTHKEQSIKFAEYVQKQYAKGPIRVNRGVKQGGLLVLWKTTMPAVLTEIGFISNTKDYNTLITTEGQNAIAKNLFNAFVAYKEEYEKNSKTLPGKNVSAEQGKANSAVADTGLAASAGKVAESGAEGSAANGSGASAGKVAESGAANSSGTSVGSAASAASAGKVGGAGQGALAGKVAEESSEAGQGSPIGNKDSIGNKKIVENGGERFYSIQVLSVGKVLAKNAPDLKGRKDCKYIKVGNLYKYYVGQYKTRQEAMNALGGVRKTFPGAFIISIKDNAIVK